MNISKDVFNITTKILRRQCFCQATHLSYFICKILTSPSLTNYIEYHIMVELYHACKLREKQR